MSEHLIYVVFLISASILAHALNDTITPETPIRDGETLISAGGTFKLGFFSTNNNNLRYVGIWYGREDNNAENKTVVWIANRDRPLSSRDGVLSVAQNGALTIHEGRSTNITSSVWSSGNATSLSGIENSNYSATLGDDGNLRVLSSDGKSTLWESFNVPTDTFLPGMRVEVESEAGGENRAFRSWSSPTDPSPGNYTMGVDPRGSPQIVIWEGSRRRWRSGHWNQQIFLGLPEMMATLLYGFKLVPENGTRFFSYNPISGSDTLRFRIEWDGFEEQLRWSEENRTWDVLQSQPALSSNVCELYNRCGDNSVCESGTCRCMPGFEPRDVRNLREGCRRRTLLKCRRNDTAVEEDGFEAVKGVKLPDFAESLPELVGGGERCEEECLKNCSCVAYAYVAGIGCMVWNGGELLDVQRFDKGGLTLNLRLARSDLTSGGGGRGTGFVVLVATLSSLAGVVILCLFAWLLWRFKLKRQVLPNPGAKMGLNPYGDVPVSDMRKSKDFSTDLSGSLDVGGIDGSQVNKSELPLYSFNFVASSTDNFSEDNKLGEGGFGDVYKGRLPGGQDIAVKRLSRKSGQGVEEFKNEIILIAKLQHRNLVRLLGCCIQEEEKMLLYEYMPNKSLDFFLFDENKQALLDWEKRFNIIEGVARGLLYLHRDSRLRIIHRDLKASNILLDEEMTPKISDFGMARIFGGNQNELNTNRVVGTYGYMSPEYAMEGLFSVKSDVYSFGVLLLEIISGRRNTSFRGSEYVSLIEYTWHLWNEGKAIELLDPSIAETSLQEDVLRCIQVAVLCVQDSPLYRPTMSSVVLMLESENSTLPLPRQPTFTSMRGRIDIDLFSGVHDASVSDITVSMVDGR